jgi:hypothetical protein
VHLVRDARLAGVLAIGALRAREQKLRP